MRIPAVIVFALSLMLASQAGSQSAQIRVLCSNGLKAVVEELRAGAEREVGRPMSIEFGTSAGIKQRIQSGESFDVTILSSEVMDEMIKAGRISAGTRT